MKVIIHDYAGHPFPVELSRELADRRHVVIHAYFAQDSGPKGDLAPVEDVHGNLRFRGVSIAREYSKTSLLRRRFGDVDYGRNVATLIREEKPDLVLSGNTPTESQEAILKACREIGSAFVFWMQDFYSAATARILRKKLGILGLPVASLYKFLEHRQFARSDAVIAITEDFVPYVARDARAAKKTFTIHNWGPSTYLKPFPKDNDWSRLHGLNRTFNFLYAGTLGLKHDPSLLVALAEKMVGRAQVVVASEGSGTEELHRQKRARSIDNLLLLPLQDFDKLPKVLAVSDVSLALLENDAGVYSVPSKVLSYLCSARPILISAPHENLAARTVRLSGAGLVVDPSDHQTFLCAAETMFADQSGRHQMAARAGSYAQSHFSIAQIVDEFEAVFTFAIGQQTGRVRSA